MVNNLEKPPFRLGELKAIKVRVLPCLRESEQDCTPQIRSPAQQNTVFLPKERSLYTS